MTEQTARLQEQRGSIMLRLLETALLINPYDHQRRSIKRDGCTAIGRGEPGTELQLSFWMPL